MKTMQSFKFGDEDLNSRLLALLKKSHIKHSVDKQGVIHYPSGEADLVENDLLCSVRDAVFPRWQVLTCPPEWIESYKLYMRGHQIPFHEELSNGKVWFLLPRRFRPHRWKLDLSAHADRIAV
ncbi:MAG TPA: hypothetical protein VHX65_03160 [Pirellulales bacterium]|jgi:hypothetical protein|nr:hypothetical protein [Pirellulales bacterium]